MDNTRVSAELHAELLKIAATVAGDAVTTAARLRAMNRSAPDPEVDRLIDLIETVPETVASSLAAEPDPR